MSVFGGLFHLPLCGGYWSLQNALAEGEEKGWSHRGRDTADEHRRGPATPPTDPDDPISHLIGVLLFRRGIDCLDRRRRPRETGFRLKWYLSRINRIDRLRFAALLYVLFICAEANDRQLCVTCMVAAGDPAIQGDAVAVWPLFHIERCLGDGRWVVDGLPGTRAAPVVWDNNGRVGFRPVFNRMCM